MWTTIRPGQSRNGKRRWHGSTLEAAAHPGWISDLAFEPAVKRLVTASFDIPLASGHSKCRLTLVHTLNHDNTVLRAVFSLTAAISPLPAVMLKPDLECLTG